DTDTLAAMAGALSGAHLGVAGVSAPWLERPGGGAEGAAYPRGFGDRPLQRPGAVLGGPPPGPQGRPPGKTRPAGPFDPPTGPPGARWPLPAALLGLSP